jgi:hypothetical protein
MGVAERSSATSQAVQGRDDELGLFVWAGLREDVGEVPFIILRHNHTPVPIFDVKLREQVWVPKGPSVL